MGKLATMLAVHSEGHFVPTPSSCAVEDNERGSVAAVLLAHLAPSLNCQSRAVPRLSD